MAKMLHAAVNTSLVLSTALLGTLWRRFQVATRPGSFYSMSLGFVLHCSAAFFLKPTGQISVSWYLLSGYFNSVPSLFPKSRLLIDSSLTSLKNMRPSTIGEWSRGYISVDRVYMGFLILLLTPFDWVLGSIPLNGL